MRNSKPNGYECKRLGTTIEKCSSQKFTSDPQNIEGLHKGMMFLGNDSLRGMSEQNCFCGPVLKLATSCSRFEPLALNV